MSITKRQHYIPRSVIKYFSKDGQYVNECQIKLEDKYYKTNINNAMCEKNIYEHRLLKTNAIENFFAATVDADLSVFEREVLPLLDASKISEVKKCFSDHADSIIRCYYRSGAILEEYNTAFRSQKGEVILHILMDTPQSYLKGLCHTILNDYHFAILKSEKLGFILGDSYLAVTALGIKSRFANASNRQIGFKDTMIILPVSLNYCIVFFHGNTPPYIRENSISLLNDPECLEINLAIYNSSYNKVVSSCENVFPMINQSNFADDLSTSPITTVMTYNSGKSIGHVVKRDAFFYQRDYEVMSKIQSHNFNLEDLEIGRNDLCYCGSGKKHKKCCIEKTEILKAVISSFNDHAFSNKVAITPRTITEHAIGIPQSEYQDILGVIDDNRAKI